MTINSRTMLVDNRNNEIRIMDWNLLDTSMGTMWEPRLLYPKCPNITFANRDPHDEDVKVDRLEYIDERELSPVLGNRLHGGYQLPINLDYN